DLKKEIILGTGSESGGLYLFDLQSDKNIGNVDMIHAFNVSKSLWHSRLGHPADQVLAVLKDELKLSKNTDVSACENCGMIGHTIDRCYELIGNHHGFKKVNNLIKQTSFKQNFNANSDVKTNDKQQSAGSQNSSSSFTLEQMKKLLILISETSSGSIHANMVGKDSF
nr:ribonuclease H-like domain-containing protein [Tanacetum cinerariifolium]